ncbi:MAG: hypothetical protein GQ569_03975 [Methylococcaceae bacterium]|nr:hypothetical protein [Methylococcaceae bacterium]
MITKTMAISLVSLALLSGCDNAEKTEASAATPVAEATTQAEEVVNTAAPEVTTQIEAVSNTEPEVKSTLMGALDKTRNAVNANEEQIKETQTAIEEATSSQ